MLTQDIKDKALALRKEGHSYREISNLLDNQISIDQCKRLLKGVERPKQTDACVAEIIELGRRPSGVTDYEATGVVYKHHEDANKNKVRYLKDKAKEVPEVVIHSGWIDHTKPNMSHRAINAFAIHIADYLEQMVDDYMIEYPNTNKWAVRHEMLKLAFSDKISPEPLSGRVYKNELLAEMLEDRLS